MTIYDIDAEDAVECERLANEWDASGLPLIADIWINQAIAMRDRALIGFRRSAAEEEE